MEHEHDVSSFLAKFNEKKQQQQRNTREKKTDYTQTTHIHVQYFVYNMKYAVYAVCWGGQAAHCRSRRTRHRIAYSHFVDVQL